MWTETVPHVCRAQRSTSAKREMMRRRPGTVTDTTFGTVPDLRCTADALHRVRDTGGNQL